MSGGDVFNLDMVGKIIKIIQRQFFSMYMVQPSVQLMLHPCRMTI